jgi:tRNA pseudouridine55 synthase
LGRRRKKGRDISGILLLDKPTGISSNAALQIAKRIFNANKAGHTGSLDPLATGLLPLCFGEATKISSYLLNADKRYLSGCKLGVSTVSGDSESEILETQPVPTFSKEKIQQVLESFLGEIEQIPPMHSAIKQNGQPLYKLARQGLEVEREPRRVRIDEIKLISYDADELEIEVACSKGTYIRTLVSDIGVKLGTGAHVTALRRLGVGDFDVKDAITLDELEETLANSGMTAIDEKLIPMENALTHWPAIKLSEDAAFYLRQGQPVLIPKAPTEGLVCLFESAGGFLGIGHVQDDGRVAPKRLLKTS